MSEKMKEFPPLVSYPEASERTTQEGEIPPYVIEFAPALHLYSEERYLPYDVKDFVAHFHAEYENGTKVDGFEESIDITQLSRLRRLEEDLVYLTANSDFDADPYWITGVNNKPRYSNGEIPQAPATLIVVDKGNGWVDAYWFYFYSFNLGPYVMGIGPFGNHVGDWEHSLVRFFHGKPIIVWMSAHGGGSAYLYDHLEKLVSDERRPVLFSARGTHAHYASVGQHPHDLPYSILLDFTDRGPLWDPAKNFLAYTSDGVRIHYANGTQPGREMEYGNWLRFNGHWGDKKLDPSDRRQHWSPWEWRYIDGPTGPMTKNLVRISPCQRAKWWNFWGGCNVRRYIQVGQGVEREGSMNTCANMLSWIKPKWLRSLVGFITWQGYFCFAMDLFFG